VGFGDHKLNYCLCQVHGFLTSFYSWPVTSKYSNSDTGSSKVIGRPEQCMHCLYSGLGHATSVEWIGKSHTPGFCPKPGPRPPELWRPPPYKSSASPAASCSNNPSILSLLQSLRLLTTQCHSLLRSHHVDREPCIPRPEACPRQALLARYARIHRTGHLIWRQILRISPFP
jgi:hypothetical protein